jgi:hypothetical protein
VANRLKLLDDESLQMESALLGRICLNATVDTLHRMKRLWVDLEGRRRILLAAFVLDIQHSTWFEQEPSCTLDFNGFFLPYPYSTETWDCHDISRWRNLVSRHLQPDLRFWVTSDDSTAAPLDAFQSSVLSCYRLHCGSGLVEPSMRDTHPPWHRSPMTHVSQTGVIRHALVLSTMTPIQHLLIVASGAWLFNTKVTERSVWHAAKANLRAWVMTDEAAKSVWHANQLLRLALSEGSLHLLQEQWCMYLAALVCWAYGFVAHPCPSRTIPDEITPKVAVAQAWEYLSAMNVPNWEGIPQVPIRWQTRGVLECVRARISGPLGGLLSQAEDVLGQLVEERSRYWEF